MLALTRFAMNTNTLAGTLEDGRHCVGLAERNGLRLSCSPFTFMGEAQQTLLQAKNSGVIGRVLVAYSDMNWGRIESWHPSPEFYYEVGGGPMFDMGPYYLTALLHFFGPIRRITGAASIAIPERTITSQPKFGRKIEVETPDHVCGIIEFVSGPVGTIIQSFATYHPTYDANQPITVYGTEGALKVKDLSIS